MITVYDLPENILIILDDYVYIVIENALLKIHLFNLGEAMKIIEDNCQFIHGLVKAENNETQIEDFSRCLKAAIDISSAGFSVKDLMSKHPGRWFEFKASIKYTKEDDTFHFMQIELNKP